MSEAKAHFEQALRINPAYLSALENLEATEAALRERSTIEGDR